MLHVLWIGSFGLRPWGLNCKLKCRNLNYLVERMLRASTKGRKRGEGCACGGMRSMAMDLKPELWN